MNGSAGAPIAVDEARRRLKSGAAVDQRRLELAGVSTSLLTGGTGTPVVLLHGQGGFAEMWVPLITGLLPGHHIVAADLPGLGTSAVHNGLPGADTTLAWLAALIDRTCAAPPVLVGHSLGGSLAARFAVDHSDRIARLVLVDAGGLAGRVRPAPRILLAMIRHTIRPSQRTVRRLFGQLSADPDQLQDRMGDRWEPFLAYHVDRSGTTTIRRANGRLLRQLGLPGIAPAALASISTPTTLIWGRHDAVMPVAGAERASARYGWPLHIAHRARDEEAARPHRTLPSTPAREGRSAA